MKAALVAVVLLLASGSARGQAIRGVRLDFRLSRVVLANDDTLSGYAALRFGPDLLCLALPDGTVRAFEPSAVKAFAVQRQVPLAARGMLREASNPDSTVVRLFRSVPGPAERAGGPPKTAFFEQLCAGPVLLLRRPYPYTQTLSTTTSTTPPDMLSRANMSGGRGLASGTSALYPMRFRTVSELREAFYLGLANGELRPIHSLNKDVIAVFPAYAPQLKALVRARSMSCTSARDLSELVNYANALAAAKSATPVN